MDRTPYGGGYRNDGREMHTSHPQRFDSDYRDYGNYGDYRDREEQGRGSYGRGARAGYGRDDASARGYAEYSQGGQQRSHSHQGHHDPDYQQWRQEQMRLLDDDYQSWRQERYQKFSDDFNSWRSSRTAQSASGKGQAGTTTSVGSGSPPMGSSAQASVSGNKSKDAS